MYTGTPTKRNGKWLVQIKLTDEELTELKTHWSTVPMSKKINHSNEKIYSSFLRGRKVKVKFRRAKDRIKKIKSVYRDVFAGFTGDMLMIVETD